MSEMVVVVVQVLLEGDACMLELPRALSVGLCDKESIETRYRRLLRE